MVRTRTHLIAFLALALVGAGLFAGCGKVSNKPGHPVREGLSTPLGGLRYTVFMTRQLNLANEQDAGYVPGRDEPPAGKALYAVFLEACNRGDEPKTSAHRFYIEDTQGNKFEPEGLGQDNPFAYHSGPVDPNNCEPARGSLAQLGPASGAILLFELPLEATENRPLELHIERPGGDPGHDAHANKATVILDV